MRPHWTASRSRRRYTLVTRFEPDQRKWMDAACFNIDDPNDAREYRLGTSFDSPHFGERPIVETFEGLLHRYFSHPESRALGPMASHASRRHAVVCSGLM